MFFNLLKELSANSLQPTTSNSGHQDHPTSQVGDIDKRILTLFITPPLPPPFRVYFNFDNTSLKKNKKCIAYEIFNLVIF